MKQGFDAVVVGAGPAGCTFASYLGRQGYKVLLVDKAEFPRDKICGDAVSGKSLGILRDFGLDKEVEKKPHSNIYGVTFSSPNGTVIEIPFADVSSPKSPGYCCRRIVLDKLLLDNAKKYAEVWEEFEVTGLMKEWGKITGIRGRQGNAKKEIEVPARLVVGCDGVYSVVAREAGVPEVSDEHKCVAARAYYKGVQGLTKNIEIHFVDSVLPGYLWVFPLDNGLANVGVGMLSSDVRKTKANVVSRMEEALAKNDLFKDRFKNAKKASETKGWTLNFGSKPRKMFGNGFLLCGDAASLIDPFTGEGMGNAMMSGKIAAEVSSSALKEKNVSEKKLEDYEKRLMKAIGPELQTSYRMQKMGRYRFLLNLVIKKAAGSQKIKETIAGMIAEPEKEKEFTNPLFYIKLLLS